MFWFRMRGRRRFIAANAKFTELAPLIVVGLESMGLIADGAVRLIIFVLTEGGLPRRVRLAGATVGQPNNI